MRKKLLTTVLLVLFMLNSTVARDPRYTALNFGNHHTNYILLKPDMEPLRREFTVCSWIKSFLGEDGASHTWISYATVSSQNEFMAGDSGKSIIFDAREATSLSEHFTALTGKRIWYHYCISANFSSGTLKFYLNGNKIGITLTPVKRYLGLGGYLALGGDQDSHGGGFAYTDRFGGELFKLNFFSKELNSSEILEMSKNMCGEIEETYGEIRYIKWEEIVQERDYRYGKIIEETECKEDCRDLLNETAEELDKVKKEKAALETRLQEKEEEPTRCKLEEKLGDKTLLYVACSLAGTFLLTTLLTCVFAGRKLFLTESSSTDLGDDYINNNVCASQGTSSRNSPSRPVPQLPSSKMEDKEERVYNNFELQL